MYSLAEFLKVAALPWSKGPKSITRLAYKPHSYFCDWSVYICLIWEASQMYRFMNKLFLFQESFSNLQYTINYVNASELFNMHEFTGIPSLSQGSFWAGPSQWDTTSHCNAVSHWPSPCPEWSLKKLSLPNMNHILVILPKISIKVKVKNMFIVVVTSYMHSNINTGSKTKCSAW